MQSYTNTKFYDGNGNIVKVTDFKSQNTEYTYNARGQRTRIRYKGMGGGGSDVDVDFDWNCCRITAYDNINRVTQHVLKDSAGPPNTLEQYDYNYSPGGLPSNTYGYERSFGRAMRKRSIRRGVLWACHSRYRRSLLRQMEKCLYK